MPKFDYPQTNFTAGEISPRLKGRWDIARYQNGAEIIENGVPVVHGGVDRRDGTRYCATTKLSEDNGVRLIGYVFNTEQSYMLEFGHLYVRFFTSTGAVILNSGLTPYELASPYTRAQLSELNYKQSGDTMLLFHPDVPVQRLRRLSATTWSLQPVPFIAEPFGEIGPTPDSTLTLSARTVGAGRTFTAGTVTVPAAPIIGTATPLNAAANVAFTAGSTGGAAITGFTATSTPGGFTGTGTASPIRVGGLSNGVAYTFKVKATNAFGTGPESAASGSVTPLGSLPGVSITASASPLDYTSTTLPNGVRTGLQGPIASGSGGIAPYTYSWSKIAGSPNLTVEVGNQAQLIMRSSGTNVENYAAFRCTVTDSTGATGTVDINAFTQHGTALL